MSEEARWTELDEFTSASLVFLVDEMLVRLDEAASHPTWTSPGSCDPGTEEINENNKLERNADAQKALREFRQVLSHHRIGYSSKAPAAGFDPHAVAVVNQCLNVSLGREHTLTAE